MLTGTHRFPRQDLVVYGRPAAEAVRDIAAASGLTRLMIVATRSIADTLATQLARDLGDLCAGLYAEVSAHSPRESALAVAMVAPQARADLRIALRGARVVDATNAMLRALLSGLA